MKPTDTMDFITRDEVPTNKIIIYANYVCNYRPLKSEQHFIRLVTGRGELTYDEDAGAPAASLTETKY